MSFRIHHNSNSESGGNRLHLTDADARQPDFNDQVKYRMQDFVSPSRWLGFLKIATASDLGKHAVRFGAQLAGVKSAKMLMLLGRLGDEAVGSSLTYQYRSEDGALAFWYEVLDGLTIWATSVSSMAALKKLGWLAKFGQSQQFLIRTALMGLGMMVGERLTKALGSQRPVNDNLWEGGALAFLDALSVGVMGASFRRVGLDVDTHVSRYTQAFASDRSDVEGETGKVVGRIGRLESPQDYYPAIQRALDSNNYSRMITLTEELLARPEFFSEETLLAQTAMSEHFRPYNLFLHKGSEAIEIKRAMYRLTRLKSTLPYASTRINQLQKRLVQTGFADMESLYYSFYGKGMNAEKASDQAVRLLSEAFTDPNEIARLATDLNETYYFMRLVQGGWYGQDPYPTQATAAHTVAQNFLNQNQIDFAQLAPKQQVQLAAVYRTAGYKEKSDELMATMFHASWFDRSQDHDAVALYVEDSMHYAFAPDSSFLPRPEAFAEPRSVSPANALLFQSIVHYNKLEAALGFLKNPDLKDDLCCYLAQNVLEWDRPEAQAKVLAAVCKEVEAGRLQPSLRDADRFLALASQLEDKPKALVLADYLAQESEKIITEDQPGRAAELYYAMAANVRSGEMEAAIQAAVVYGSHYGHWARPDDYADYRQFFISDLVQYLISDDRSDQALEVLDSFTSLTLQERILKVTALASTDRLDEMEAEIAKVVKEHNRFPIQKSPGNEYALHQLVGYALFHNIDWPQPIKAYDYDAATLSLSDKLYLARLYMMRRDLDKAQALLAELDTPEIWKDLALYGHLVHLYEAFSELKGYQKIDGRGPLVSVDDFYTRGSSTLVNLVSHFNIVFSHYEQDPGNELRAQAMAKAEARLKYALPQLLRQRDYSALGLMFFNLHPLFYFRAIRLGQAAAAADYQLLYFQREVRLGRGDQEDSSFLDNIKKSIADIPPYNDQQVYYAGLTLNSADRTAAAFEQSAGWQALQPYMAMRASPLLQTLTGDDLANRRLVLMGTVKTNAGEIKQGMQRFVNWRLAGFSEPQYEWVANCVERLVELHPDKALDPEVAALDIEAGVLTSQTHDASLKVYRQFLRDYQQEKPGLLHRLSVADAYHYTQMLRYQNHGHDAVREEFVRSYLKVRADGFDTATMSASELYYLARLFDQVGFEQDAKRILGYAYVLGPGDQKDPFMILKILEFQFDLLKRTHRV